MTLHNLTTTEQIVLEAFPKEREVMVSAGNWIDSNEFSYFRVGTGEADVLFCAAGTSAIRIPIPANTPCYAWTSASTTQMCLYVLPMK